ncbi:MAG TPA: galactokinase [Acidobacteriaceae bacterium]
MFITRTPLRISIGGGGTDLPSYYQEFGGFVISAAIDKYSYVSVNRCFSPGYLLKYSEMETVRTRAEIRHRLIRETLNVYDIESPIEIVSIADVPAGTGLGSSSTFLVGLIHALHAFTRTPVGPEKLAREAIEIEMNRLQEPVGKQDHYIAAYGGILCQEYNRDGTANVYSLKMSESSIQDFRNSLMLFYVGATRNGSSILIDQKQKSEQHDRTMLEGLHFIKQLGLEIQSTLQAGEISRFGELMHEHWLRKRSRTKGMSSDHIDELYQLALSKGGATGGKLVGAGGSGFLLFQTTDRARLRRTMYEAGMVEMNFVFDFNGSIAISRN